MLPYFDQPVLVLGPMQLYAFGLVVGLAVVVGIELAVWRGRHAGIDASEVQSFAIWVVGTGFVAAHLCDALWYHPDEVLRTPEILIELTAGLSSFGGFLGAIVGALAWRLRAHRTVLPLVENTLSVFPAAWAIGRLGCTLAHDHPGIHTSAGNWLAFAYPDGPRWDLGFLEMLFSIALAAVCALLWRKPRPLGTYIALTCLAYAPVRFALDFLRLPADAEGDARYGGLTPAQWASFVLLAVGLAGLWLIRDERGRRKRAQVGGSDARCLESDRSHSTPRRRSSAA